MMNYYYLYLIKFEDGKLYIGSRKSEVPAVEDTNYWGSPGKTIKHLWEMKKEKYILFESTNISLQDLREKEYKLIGAGWKKYGKEKCINKNCGGLNNIDIEVIKESGKRCRDQKLGIFGWTVEERSKNSKEIWHSNKNARGFMSWDDEKIKEFREQQRKKFCKTYTFINPNGNEVIVNDLQTFCKKNNLCSSTMNELSKGKYIQHRGWSLVGPKKVKELQEQSWEDRYEDKIFYDPSGKQIIINCFSTFARKNNLNLHCLRFVYVGEMLQHKGYSVLHPDEVKKEKQKLIDSAIKRNAKTVKMKNPEGQVMEIYNLVGFCKENGLNPGNMHNVLTGRKKSCKGWTKP
jgi:hypothetical protein